MPKIIVIGGGIAGLAAAVHLKAGAKAHGKTVEVLLLEKNNRIGGKILTEKQGQFLDRRRARQLPAGKGLERQSCAAPRPGTGDAAVERRAQGDLHLFPEKAPLPARRRDAHGADHVHGPWRNRASSPGPAKCAWASRSSCRSARTRTTKAWRPLSRAASDGNAWRRSQNPSWPASIPRTPTT